MLNQNITHALKTEEFGDARSFLDEYHWPNSNPQDLIDELNPLSTASWFYDANEGWTYEENPLCELVSK